MDYEDDQEEIYHVHAIHKEVVFADDQAPWIIRNQDQAIGIPIAVMVISALLFLVVRKARIGKI